MGPREGAGPGGAVRAASRPLAGGDIGQRVNTARGEDFFYLSYEVYGLLRANVRAPVSENLSGPITDMVLRLRLP